MAVEVVPAAPQQYRYMLFGVHDGKPECLITRNPRQSACEMVMVTPGTGDTVYILFETNYNKTRCRSQDKPACFISMTGSPRREECSFMFDYRNNISALRKGLVLLRHVVTAKGCYYDRIRSHFQAHGMQWPSTARALLACLQDQVQEEPHYSPAVLRAFRDCLAHRL